MSDVSPVEPVRDRDHVRGPSDAAITVIEYGDYDCPHTRKAEAVVARLLAENPDMRLAFRLFPLRHLHASAEMLARIAQAAALQGKFWPMHDLLMRGRVRVDDEQIAACARAVGLDVVRLRKDMREPAVAGRIEQDVRQGGDAGVHSTPTFFFDGALHDGHYDHDTLARRLGAARKKAA